MWVGQVKPPKKNIPNTGEGQHRELPRISIHILVGETAQSFPRVSVCLE